MSLHLLGTGTGDVSVDPSNIVERKLDIVKRVRIPGEHIPDFDKDKCVHAVKEKNCIILYSTEKKPLPERTQSKKLNIEKRRRISLARFVDEYRWLYPGNLIKFGAIDHGIIKIWGESPPNDKVRPGDIEIRIVHGDRMTSIPKRFVESLLNEDKDVCVFKDEEEENCLILCSPGEMSPSERTRSKRLKIVSNNRISLREFDIPVGICIEFSRTADRMKIRWKNP